MSRPNFINSNVVYHDNSKEYNIDARGKDLASIIRACEAEDIQPEEVKPRTAEKQTQQQAYAAPFPKENDYNAVREYVEERKKYDEVFRQYCKTHTRTQLCERLTDEFGWVVDANHYGHNLRRNL